MKWDRKILPDGSKSVTVMESGEWQVHKLPNGKYRVYQDSVHPKGIDQPSFDDAKAWLEMYLIKQPQGRLI